MWFVDEYFREIIICFCSTCTCFFIHFVITPLFPILFIPYRLIYERVEEKKKFDWNNRFVCALHSIIALSVCTFTYVRFPEFWYWSNINFYRPEINYLAAISLGYFFYDTALIIYDKPNYSSNTVFFVHHIVSIIIISLVLYMRSFHLGSLYAGMLEWAIPCVHMYHWLKLAKIGEDSIIFRINNLLLTFLFLFFRIVLGSGYFGYILFIYKRSEYIELIGYVQYFFWVMIYFLLSYLNVMWMKKIFRLLVRTYKEPQNTATNNVKLANGEVDTNCVVVMLEDEDQDHYSGENSEEESGLNTSH